MICLGESTCQSWEYELGSSWLGLWLLFLSSPEQRNKEMINSSLPQSSAFACVFSSVSHASMCSSEVHLST